MTKQHQQFYQARKEIFSFYQLRIGQSFLRGRGNETIQPIHRLYFYISIIQPERKFINITAQMFLARMVINAMQSAFQNSPNTLNTVRANSISEIFAGTM